ncbi:MAG: hypothetical protein QM714_15080 [Nocardioides sp.]|uniref:hypothetical protein n=1 Tax=Nocardioides sp. TaxID=35761 RepID=UPI0039E359FF
MASSPSARRRQRSRRVIAAVILLLAACGSIAVAVTVGSVTAVTVSAVVAVLLGAGATTLTHAELMDSRRENARVRAQEARAFASLTEARAAENTAFVESMTEQLTRNQATLAQVEDALCAAQHRAAETARQLKAEKRLVEATEAKTLRTAAKLDDAEERAAEAIVRVAELEQERDVLKAELAAWESVGVEGLRKHA